MSQERPAIFTSLGEGSQAFEEIDKRGQLILSEIHRCIDCKDEYIESGVLHNVPQTFVTTELRNKLEAELDRLLMEQILQEERQFPHHYRKATTWNSPTSDFDHSKPTCSLQNTGFATSVVNDEALSNYSDSMANSKTSQVEACFACNAYPCQWAPFCDADLLARRKKNLYREMMYVQKQRYATTVQSVVAGSVLKGGGKQFLPSDLLQELSSEIKDIDSKLKLCLIDNELHMAYASRCECVTIRSIHGYDTTVKRDGGILALEHERNRHIANIAAAEIIDGILEW